MSNYYLYFDRSQKPDNFFIVTEVPLHKQDPMMVSQDKAELENICIRLNSVLQSQLKKMLDDQSFFLK
jgi:hypothetical protein